MPKLTRAEVYAIVDGERDYQEAQSRNPERPDMNPVLPLPGHILAMEELLSQARTLWYHGSGDHEDAMCLLRKVVGMGVRAGEHFGMPPRAQS